MDEYTPEHLTRWTMPDSYFGNVWPEYYVGLGQHRDSDALARSNFRSFLKAIGGGSETVTIVREGHWAVGWVEWIAIHQDDYEALREADAIIKGLDDYPVVNEDDWSELEMEEAHQVWANCYSDKERVEYIRKYRSQFDFNDMSEVIAVARGRYFTGYASELIN